MNIAKFLQEAGYGVKFEHVADKESFVALFVGDVEIVRHEDLQHNRNYNNNQALSKALVEKFTQAVSKGI